MRPSRDEKLVAVVISVAVVVVVVVVVAVVVIRVLSRRAMQLELNAKNGMRRSFTRQR